MMGRSFCLRVVLLLALSTQDLALKIIPYPRIAPGNMVRVRSSTRSQLHMFGSAATESWSSLDVEKDVALSVIQAPPSFGVVSLDGQERTIAGSINWSNPLEAVVGTITLLYVGFSILAGIKYIVKDGWRPPGL